MTGPAEGERVHVRVGRDPLDVAGVLTRVGTEQDGAVVLFLGNVRNHHEGRSVDGILYEGYEPMAEDLLEALAREAVARFGVTRVAVEHRLGGLEVGETSVALAVSSPHRAESFEAARWLMEELKRRIPVWKKERFTEGDSAWVRGRDPREEDASGSTVAEVDHT